MTDKNTPIQDPDKFDGLKAIGCLFIGVVILCVLGVVFYALVNHFIP